MIALARVIREIEAEGLDTGNRIGVKADCGPSSERVIIYVRDKNPETLAVANRIAMKCKSENRRVLVKGGEASKIGLKPHPRG